MDAASIVILGVMGPMLLLCIIGIPIVLHINKKERQAEEEEEADDDLSNKATVIPPPNI